MKYLEAMSILQVNNVGVENTDLSLLMLQIALLLLFSFGFYLKRERDFTYYFFTLL
jgi:hypothetical protein